MELRGDLFVMDRAGNNPRKVVSFGAAACDYDSDYAEHFCQGLPVDPSYLPGGDSIVYSQLLSVAENGGRGRWNVFSAATSALDQDIVNLTNHPTAYQDIAHASTRGIVFHEVDIAVPFYGIVFIELGGGGRTVLIDDSSWAYYLGAASWLTPP